MKTSLYFICFLIWVPLFPQADEAIRFKEADLQKEMKQDRNTFTISEKEVEQDSEINKYHALTRKIRELEDKLLETVVVIPSADAIKGCKVKAEHQRIWVDVLNSPHVAQKKEREIKKTVREIDFMVNLYISDYIEKVKKERWFWKGLLYGKKANLEIEKIFENKKNKLEFMECIIDNDEVISQLRELYDLQEQKKNISVMKVRSIKQKGDHYVTKVLRKIQREIERREKDLKQEKIQFSSQESIRTCLLELDNDDLWRQFVNFSNLERIESDNFPEPTWTPDSIRERIEILNAAYSSCQNEDRVKVRRYINQKRYKIFGCLLQNKKLVDKVEFLDRLYKLQNKYRSGSIVL